MQITDLLVAVVVVVAQAPYCLIVLMRKTVGADLVRTITSLKYSSEHNWQKS